MKSLWLYCLMLCLSSCASSDDNNRAALARANAETKVFEAEAASLSYREVSGTGEAVVIFIHGTPGSWDAFRDYLISGPLIAQSKRLISIDRPGWGDSSLVDQTTQVMNLADQSAVMGAWLAQEFSDDQVILVGHSLGASLIARLLVDHDQLVDGAMLLAGGYDATLSTPRWYNRIAKSLVIKPLIGETMRNSNREMLWLAQDLQQAEAGYRSITTAMTIVQGEKDFLVDPAHLDSAKAYWPHARFIYLEDVGHFLPWQQQALIEKEIIQLIKP